MTTFTNPFPQWNDTGQNPDDTANFDKNIAGGDNAEAEHYDFLWDQQYKTLQSIISEFDTEVIRRDGSVSMDADLDLGGNALVNGDVQTTYKGNDIDSDGDGTVDSADTATEALSFEARTNYPTSPSSGRVVFRTDKT